MLLRFLGKVVDFLINVVLMSIISSILISTVICFCFVFFYFEAVKAPEPKIVHGEEVPAPEVSIFRRNLGRLDSNFITVTHLSQKYLNEFHNFENFKTTVAPVKKPPYCSLICKDSFFEDEVYIRDRVPYLKNYASAQKQAAWSDPWFRLRFGEMDFLSSAIPAALQDMLRVPPESDTTFWQASRWKKALQMEMTLLRQSETIWKHFKEIRTQNHRLNKLKTLISECEHSNATMIGKKCSEEFPEGSPLD